MMSIRSQCNDRFGNALGGSIADGLGRGSQQTEVLYGAEEQAQDFARENARFAAMGIRQAGRSLLLADSGQFMTDAGSLYGDVNFGEPVKQNATSDAMFNALVDGIQNPRPAAGPRIVLDDFGNPVGGQTGAGYLDQSEIDRENYLLASRSRTISSNSPSGMLTQDGKPYYLIMRDPNGLGIYQWPDDMRSASAKSTGGLTSVSGDGTAIFGTTGESRLLGSLSMKYETGKNPSQYGEAAGTVSSGLNDKGGISYGAYQLASSKAAGEQVQRFLKYEGAPWASEFSGLDPKQPGAFGQQWRAIAQASPDQFFAAQHSYIERTHYTPVVRYLADTTGLNVSMQPGAVQDAVWSASVQHGGAKYFLADAVRSTDQLMERSNAGYAATLINTIYDKRTDYVSSLNIPNKQSLLQVRYPDKRQRALEMLNGCRR